MMYYEKPGIRQGLVRFLSHFQTGSRNSFSKVQAGTVSLSEIPSDTSSYQKHMIMENISHLYYLDPLNRSSYLTKHNPCGSLVFLSEILFQALWLRAPHTGFCLLEDRWSWHKALLRQFKPELIVSKISY